MCMDNISNGLNDSDDSSISDSASVLLLSSSETFTEPFFSLTTNICPPYTITIASSAWRTFASSLIDVFSFVLRCFRFSGSKKRKQRRTMSPISTNLWTHWDPLKYYPCTVDHAQLPCRTFFYLFSSPSHSNVRILFHLPHFARVASFKKNWATEKWSVLLRRLEHIAKHKGFLEILFTRTLTVVNFPSTDWFSYLRTQLKAFVGRVCLQSRRFFLHCFLE